MDNRLTTYKAQIPEGKVQFFESVEDLRENTVNNTKEILSDKEKLINLLKEMNKNFSLTKMGKLLKICRNDLSSYISGKNITDELSIKILSNKKSIILEILEEKKEETEKYKEIQENLQYFTSKIPENDLAELLGISRITLEYLKFGKIKKITGDKIDILSEQIIAIKNNYLLEIEEVKKLFFYLKEIITISEIEDIFNISSSSIYLLINRGRIKYSVLKDILENYNIYLNKYPKNIEEYNELKLFFIDLLNKEKKIIGDMDLLWKKFNISQKLYRKLMSGGNIHFKYIKKNITLILNVKNEQKNDNLFYINFFKGKEESDFTNILLKLTLPSNRRKLLLKGYNIKDNIEILYKTKDFGELEKIEKLLN